MSDRYGYIAIETLLNFCENSKDHAVTPNDFMRMARVRVPERKTGKWIPWKSENDEHLKDRHYYLVTMRTYDTPMKAKYYDEVLPHWKVYGTTIENTEYIYFADDQITAYMELPKCYKGDET